MFSVQWPIWVSIGPLNCVETKSQEHIKWQLRFPEITYCRIFTIQHTLFYIPRIVFTNTDVLTHVLCRDCTAAKGVYCMSGDLRVLETRERAWAHEREWVREWALKFSRECVFLWDGWREKEKKGENSTSWETYVFEFVICLCIRK